MTSVAPARDGLDERPTDAESTDPARHQRSVVLLALVLGTVLAVWGLTARSLWLDEAFSLGATNQLHTTLRDTAGTMGLYYVVLDGWTWVWGDSVAALRALSVLCAVLVVIPLTRLGRLALHRSEVTLGTLVLVGLASHTRYAQEARSYALVMVLTAVAWVCLARAVALDHGRGTSRAGGWWAAFALLSVAGVLSHGLYVLQLGVQVASLLLLPGRRVLLRGAAPAVLATMACLAFLLSLGVGAVAEWVPPLSAGQIVDLGRELFAPALWVTVPLLGLAALGAAALARRPAADPTTRWLTLVPVLWGFGPPILLVGLSIVRPYGIGRYVIASVPALALLIAVGALHVIRSRPLRGRKGARFLVLVSLVVLLACGQVQIHQRGGPDWREAAELVAAGADGDDTIVFTFARQPFEAAWREVPRPAEAIPLAPTARPLGTVQRYTPAEPWATSEAWLIGRDRLWIVHQTMTGAGDTHLDRVLDLPVVRDGYLVEAHHRFDGGVQVVVLVPRR